MRWLSISLVALLFIACANPNNSETVEGISSTTSTESEPDSGDTQGEEGPKWEPKPLHVYILDDTIEPCEEAIIDEYIGEDEAEHNAILDKAKAMVTSHNQDYPKEPRRAVGGGT